MSARYIESIVGDNLPVEDLRLKFGKEAVADTGHMRMLLMEETSMGKRLAIVFAALFFLMNAATMVMAKSNLKQIGEFVVGEANQAVGVDDKYFYAVDNQTIAKYDKKTGVLVKKWKGEKNGPIIHLDSAMLMDGKIYCAHSNYSEWPMTSSVEIWDAETMEHTGNHSFGIRWGSLTWVDFYNGHWWMTFANYDKPYGPGKTPYGYKATT
jgi:hypothetical protein